VADDVVVAGEVAAAGCVVERAQQPADRGDLVVGPASVSGRDPAVQVGEDVPALVVLTEVARDTIEPSLLEQSQKLCGERGFR